MAERFQKNAVGELYESRIETRDGVEYRRTDFYVDDPHEDISHCHLRTEYVEIEKGVDK